MGIGMLGGRGYFGGSNNGLGGPADVGAYTSFGPGGGMDVMGTLDKHNMAITQNMNQGQNGGWGMASPFSSLWSRFGAGGMD